MDKCLVAECDHENRKSEWVSYPKHTYRTDPSDSDKLQFKIKTEYFCPCGRMVKYEITQDWTGK